MTEEEINQLTDEAFAIVAAALSGAKHGYTAKQIGAAMDYVRPIQIVAWSLREEARKQAEVEAAAEEEADQRRLEFPDTIEDK